MATIEEKPKDVRTWEMFWLEDVFFKLDRKTNDWLKNGLSKENHGCGQWSFCDPMDCKKVHQFGDPVFEVWGFITCKAKFIVYMVRFHCSLFFIWKMICPLYVRFREHVRPLRTGLGSPHLIQPMQEYHGDNPKEMSTSAYNIAVRWWR